MSVILCHQFLIWLGTVVPVQHICGMSH